MAHPFADKRQGKVEHSRVAKITNGYASGGAVAAAPTAGVAKRATRAPTLRATGGSVKARADRPARASGGRVKPVTVNVVVAPQGGKDDAGLAGAPPMMPPPGPPPGGPPMPPPGAGGPPPGGPPMPPPIRSSGGRAYASGGSVFAEGKRNGTKVSHTDSKQIVKDNMNRPKPITYASGGKVKRADGGEVSKPRIKPSDLIGIGIPDLVSNATRKVLDTAASKLKERRQENQDYGDKVAKDAAEYNRGGPINAPAGKKGMAPDLGGGSRGGKARMAKEKRAAKNYHKPIKRVGI